MIKAEPIDFGNLSEAKIKDLYPDPNTRNYVREQEKKFTDCLPELKLRYHGLYVVFEDGLIIDSDRDEIALLVRASKNATLRSRPLVFCKFIQSPKEGISSL